MRKIICILTCLFFLIDCGPEERDGTTYQSTILNKSGQTVTMTLFVNDIRDPASSRTLKNNEEIKKTEIKYASGGGTIPLYCLLNSNFSEDINKFEIVFNNNKKIIYERCIICNNPRNIFDVSYGDDFVEIYTITPEDFQNAVDCGGNCY